MYRSEFYRTETLSPEEHLPISKQKLFEMLGGYSCQKCGYEEDWRALEIDHIYGKDKGVDPIRNIQFWLESPDSASEELQVLCANCHRIKTWEDKKGW